MNSLPLFSASPRLRVNYFLFHAETRRRGGGML
jgi:hypothetical protein